MTYFFAEGHIYVILNKLAKLSTKDYNAEGTASMVIKTLCETLGFTELKLTNVLKHFVYDEGRLSGKFNSNVNFNCNSAHTFNSSNCNSSRRFMTNSSL